MNKFYYLNLSILLVASLYVSYSKWGNWQHTKQQLFFEQNQIQTSSLILIFVMCQFIFLPVPKPIFCFLFSLHLYFEIIHLSERS